MIHASAPGKLLLAGEYSVLLPGGTSLVAAVDRRVFVDASDAGIWSAHAGQERWRDGEAAPEGLRFVVAAIEAVRERFDVAPRALVTRDELTVDGRKLGLGGSAAATVAAAFASAEGSGATRDELWALCDEVHRAVQRGRGSGADVAASVFGGVAHYVKEPRAARRVEVHPDVKLVCVWTGRSAKTVPRLERFLDHFGARENEARMLGWMSNAAVETLERGLVAGELETIRGAIGRARAVLKALETDAGLELETEALKLASDVAWKAGAAGKLSGAGGGDCAIALAVGAEMGERLVLALRAAGLDAFELAFAKEGVRVDRD